MEQKESHPDSLIWLEVSIDCGKAVIGPGLGVYRTPKMLETGMVVDPGRA